MKMIDAHIHLDHYRDEEIEKILMTSPQVEGLVSVSFDLESSKRNLLLSKKYSLVKPAFGYHPEQRLPSEAERQKLFKWLEEHRFEMVAIGEVGLPYYSRLEGKVSNRDFGAYLDLLASFIQLAKRWELPIVLHAVYDDAPSVCDLLEKHSITKAHFHWFKGDDRTITRMIENGYYVSITPDVVYEEEIQCLVKRYPINKLMIETDGPWPFEGPFLGQMTHPKMMEYSIERISLIKNMAQEEIAQILLENTKSFYQI